MTTPIAPEFFKAGTDRVGFNYTTTPGHCRIVRVVDEIRADYMISTLCDYLLQSHANVITAKGKWYCDLSPGLNLLNV
ncbi:hypothetical protein D3C81_114740 [compost metagenome]